MIYEDEQYFEGWPKLPGWYDVLIDGQPERLRHWICQMSGRHEWVDYQGNYIRNAEVLWTGEPDVRP